MAWVWEYAERKADTAFCNLCTDQSNGFACFGETSDTLQRHLKNAHKIMPGSKSSVEISTSQPTKKLKYRHQEVQRRPHQMEQIHQALAKMIVTNQLPLSFCSSEGFKQFMATVEPDYKACTEDSIKTRLLALQNSLKEHIKLKLKTAAGIACTTDFWTSKNQDSYLTVTAHFIDVNWSTSSFILGTYALDDTHMADNLTTLMSNTFRDWNIKEKVICIVNNHNALQSSVACNTEFKENITCAAHCIQLAVNEGLACHGSIQPLLEKANDLVHHFKHSSLALQILKQKQSQLKLPPNQTPLLTYDSKWNSAYLMLERLLKNRIPILNVLADRSVFTISIAEKLSLSEADWKLMGKLVEILMPLDLLTSILCSDKNSPISMIRPLLRQLLSKFLLHNEEDEELVKIFKSTVANNLEQKFQLADDFVPDCVTAMQAASFLDPRFKELEHENITCRQQIREFIKSKMKLDYKNDIASRSGLNLFFNLPIDQFERYLSKEIQVGHDSNPFDWWKERAKDYPALSILARKLLSIPASSTSSDRCLSTAENIEAAKRALPENKDMLVFLYQNRAHIPLLN